MNKRKIAIIMVVVLLLAMVCVLTACSTTEADIQGTYRGASIVDGTYSEAELILKDDHSFQLTTRMPYISQQSYSAKGIYKISGDKIYLTFGASQTVTIYTYHSSNKSLTTDRNNITLYKV